jgi:hypothetical protein
MAPPPPAQGPSGASQFLTAALPLAATIASAYNPHIGRGINTGLAALQGVQGFQNWRTQGQEQQQQRQQQEREQQRLRDVLYGTEPTESTIEHPHPERFETSIQDAAPRFGDLGLGDRDLDVPEGFDLGLTDPGRAPTVVPGQPGQPGLNLPQGLAGAIEGLGITGDTRGAFNVLGRQILGGAAADRSMEALQAQLQGYANRDAAQAAVRQAAAEARHQQNMIRQAEEYDRREALAAYKSHTRTKEPLRLSQSQVLVDPATGQVIATGPPPRSRPGQVPPADPRQTALLDQLKAFRGERARYLGAATPTQASVARAQELDTAIAWTEQQLRDLGYPLPPAAAEAAPAGRPVITGPPVEAPTTAEELFR